MITEKITSGQKKQIARFMEDALSASNPSKKGSQRLIEKGGDFQEKIRQLVSEFSMVETYEDEEVSSKYGYLSGYKPKSITEQTNKLRELFPGVGYANEAIARETLPNNAEGWFAIPRWQSIAPTYGEAVEKVFMELKKIRNGNFVNYCDGKLGPKNLRQLEKTAKRFDAIAEEQKGYDILTIPAQFGILHRGQSVRRARVLMDDVPEFGLGSFAIGIMLLTHPERLVHYDDLWIDCAGDEFSPDAGGVFSGSPFFRFSGGRLEFGTGDVSDAGGYYGSASGFVPQL